MPSASELARQAAETEEETGHVHDLDLLISNLSKAIRQRVAQEMEVGDAKHALRKAEEHERFCQAAVQQEIDLRVRKEAYHG